MKIVERYTGHWCSKTGVGRKLVRTSIISGVISLVLSLLHYLFIALLLFLVTFARKVYCGSLKLFTPPPLALLGLVQVLTPPNQQNEQHMQPNSHKNLLGPITVHMHHPSVEKRTDFEHVNWAGVRTRLDLPEELKEVPEVLVGYFRHSPIRY